MSSRAAANVEGAPLTPVLAVTVLVSIGTGVIWNGIAFIAKHDYDYSQTASLWLYAVIGAVYVAGAFTAGRALRRVERLLSAPS